MKDNLGPIFKEEEVNLELIERFRDNCFFWSVENKILNVTAFQLEKNKFKTKSVD